jgi:hypothetical protein
MATTAEAKNIKELEHTTLLNPEAEVLYFSVTFAYRDAPSETGSHGTGVRSVKGVTDIVIGRGFPLILHIRGLYFDALVCRHAFFLIR